MQRSYFTSHGERRYRPPLPHGDINRLFKRLAPKSTLFDLNELVGSYNSYETFKRLHGHLKRWNLSVSRGDKCNEKESSLYDKLYSMLKYIKYQQPSIQEENLNKLEEWFLPHYRQDKPFNCFVKTQNLDKENEHKEFRNRATFELLKNYSKPYQISIKLFEAGKRANKTRKEKEEECIARSMKRVVQKETTKFIEGKEEEEMARTIESFKHHQAKRKMTLDKTRLKHENVDMNRSQVIEKSASEVKVSKSLHTMGTHGENSAVDFMFRRVNANSLMRNNVDLLNLSKDNTRSFDHRIHNESLQILAPLTPSAKPSTSPSPSSFPSGYSLMVNPFFTKQSRKGRRKK